MNKLLCLVLVLVLTPVFFAGCGHPFLGDRKSTKDLDRELQLTFSSVKRTNKPSVENKNHKESSFLHNFCSLDNISKSLEFLVSSFSQTGRAEYALGGGSALNLLVRILDRRKINKPSAIKNLVMDRKFVRDIDIFVGLKDCVPISNVSIESFSNSYHMRIASPLHPKQRAYLDSRGRMKRAAVGLGVTFVLENKVNYDLGFLNHIDYIRYNGLINLENISIVVSRGSSLVEVCEKISRLGYSKSVEFGLVLDPFLGYKSFVDRSFRMANTRDFELDPYSQGLRILRSFYTKTLYPPSEDEINKAIKYIRSKVDMVSGPMDEKLYNKNLARVLSGSHRFILKDLASKSGLIR